jgi:N-acyl-D-amino-acid deacylase
METEEGWENWFRHIGFDWNKLIVGSTPNERYAPLAGQSLAAMAKARDEDPWDTFFNLAKSGAFVLPESMTEANLVRAMQQEFVSFCTDVGPAGGSGIASHPRAFGAFPRLLSRYVRDLGSISLERAVAQASAAAANEVLAYDRGRIAVGLAADVIVFDYPKLTEKATFAEPQKLAEGMRHVVVNGELVWNEEKLTGRRPGKVLRGPGYKRPAPELGAGKAAPLDRMFAQFMEKHRVPGCAVAVSHGGKLVYARGLGFADIAERTPVTPTSLFRIASISKPVTAVAILRLVEQGKLKLDDSVFDLLNLQELVADETKLDERQRKITVRHLLQHRGGWDREQSFDAMFQAVRFAEALQTPAPAGPQEIIRCMLQEQLDFSPGERYAYSNYGYCLLGRVIEKLTGQPYEAYVREQVLAPAGAVTMRLGRTQLGGRLPKEVRYYDPATGPSVFAADRGQIVAHPYGAWHLEAMDAHGGWLASAVDLVRFADALDEGASSPLLKTESLREMWGPPTAEPEKDKEGKPKETYYALGWNVRPAKEGRLTTWHTGSLPGTATILIRRYDGLNIAVLFNARVSPYAEHLTRALEGPLHAALDAVEVWPEEDLFAKYPLEAAQQ